MKSSYFVIKYFLFKSVYLNNHEVTLIMEKVTFFFFIHVSHFWPTHKFGQVFIMVNMVIGTSVDIIVIVSHQYPSLSEDLNIECT